MNETLEKLTDRLSRRETWAFVLGLVIAALDATGVIGPDDHTAAFEYVAALLGVGAGAAVVRGHQKGELLFGKQERDEDDDGAGGERE